MLSHVPWENMYLTKKKSFKRNQVKTYSHARAPSILLDDSGNKVGDTTNYKKIFVVLVLLVVVL